MVDPFSNEIVYAEEWPWGGTEEHPNDTYAKVSFPLCPVLIL